MATLAQQLESVLFAIGRPERVKKLATLLKVKPQEITSAATELQGKLEEQGSGLAVLLSDDQVQLVTSPGTATLIADLQREELEGPLSRAALETLAIIAYHGPLTKPEIDAVRGVNSGIMLRTLLIRGLVARERSATDARTFRYEITPDFMRFLGITKKAELPQYDVYNAQKVVTKLAEQAVAAVQARQGGDGDGAAEATAATETTATSEAGEQTTPQAADGETVPEAPEAAPQAQESKPEQVQ